MENKKRITVYLDLNIDSDREIWDYLVGKRKTEVIRQVLFNHIKGSPLVVAKEVVNEFTQDDFDVLDDIVKQEQFIYSFFTYS